MPSSGDSCPGVTPEEWLRARQIPGRLNVIADKLFRHNQVIQTERSLSQQVFNLLLKMGPTTCRPVCNPVQSQSPKICVTGTGVKGSCSAYNNSAPSVVNNLSVGGCLQNFWRTSEKMGANPRVVSILKEGYTLPFKMRPPLTRSPVVWSGYTNPVKNRFLKDALLALMQKLVVEKVVVRSSLAFYNRLFLVPKPNKWRPILDLSQLNLYLCPGTFKLETPQTIRLSLQTGKWVTLLDFSETYFHIPI